MAILTMNRPEKRNAMCDALVERIFRRALLTRENRTIRYLSDSSYWLYLVHLPIVVWLQVAVAEIPLHWSLKLAFISVATIALALLSYDLFVRSTWLGTLLNGRRRGRVAPCLLNNLPCPWRDKQVKQSIILESDR